MDAVSPWAIAACDRLNNSDLQYLYVRTISGYSFNLYNSGDSLWVIVQKNDQCRISFRTAFTPNSFLEVTNLNETKDGLQVSLKGVIGKYEVKIIFPDEAQPLIRYTTTFKASASLMVPFWPRDIIITGIGYRAATPDGEIHASQEGLRSGFVYASVNKAGSFLYLQNLSSLGDYCEQTKTSLADTVGGQWPELGFALPPTKDTPLKAGEEYILSDAIIVLDSNIPKDEFAVAKQFMDLTALAYMQLPRPHTQFHNWPDYVKKCLHDLETSHGCWTQVKGRAWLTPYVSDYDSPPEIMVQLTVLLPILEYSNGAASHTR